MKLRSKVLVVSFIVQFTLLGISHAQELKRIRIGYPSLSFRQSNVWVAKEQGLFKKYGLEVEPIYLRGGQVATQALAAGDPPIVNIGTVVQANDQIVFSRKGINRLEDLRGKIFGISSFGSATHNAANILFKHLGMEPNKDVVLVPGGPDAERIAALMGGRIDATMVTSSAAPPARKAGFNELLQIADLGVEVQGNGFATSRAYITTNRDTVKNALRGFVEAIYFIYANKKEAQKVFAKYMRTNDPEVLEDSYQGYVKMIPKKPYPTLKGIQYLLDILAPQFPAAKTAKPEQFVDLSFLQELEKEGFFNEMAKRYPTK
ncbi:MAG: ABC-type nitrate/sulfonate/bicarbonate transport system, periplasmic component [Deltaproteobacteria bacterium]|nr:ABC-type nitrate/sulfonate/bicarbonate transport system, periplasmic component [Deltaproteobacteria bacterium]